MKISAKKKKEILNVLHVTASFGVSDSMRGAVGKQNVQDTNSEGFCISYNIKAELCKKENTYGTKTAALLYDISHAVSVF